MQSEMEENSREIPESSEDLRQEAYYTYKPWICIFISLVCVILCLGYNFDSSENSWEKYRRWGAPDPYDIWNGELWGLFTANFLHLELWHIASNLYWLGVLGKKVEFESKGPFFILLILSSGIISSLYQLALSGETGIGLSGIVYALFGFILVKSYLDVSYKNFLGRGLVSLFILWLFFCIYLTYKNILQIGNAAHFAGLFWGMVLAYTSSKSNNLARLKIPVFLFALSFSTLYWARWSVGYLSHEAFQLHAEGKLDEASKKYRSILRKDPKNEFALENLKGIKIDSLGHLAFKKHQEGDLTEAARLYRTILAKQAKKEITDFAKENLKMIMVDSLSKLAYNFHVEQNIVAANKLYQEILKIDPNNKWAKTNLGVSE